jgi:6,7-dimethyl-8-ribityllumazine synthase
MECLEGQVVATDYKLAFVVARFNELITENLLQGATDAFLRHGGKEEHLTIAKVPGAFEIPLVAKKLAGTGRYDA